jgi:hypothetical protein
MVTESVQEFNMDWTAVGFPLELRRFSLHHQSQNDFVAQSSFYPTGTRYSRKNQSEQ